MGNHSKPSEQKDPGKPWKPRRLVILAAVPCLAAAAFGGAALASGGSTPRTPLTVNLDGEAGTTGLGVTVYACLASGRLTHVTVAAAPNCPAGSVRVHWSGQSDPTSAPTSPAPVTSSSSGSAPTSAPPTAPTSTPPTAPTTAPPTTSAPTSPATGPQCVTSSAKGSCGPYSFAGITGSSGSSTYVLNNMWAANSGTTQTLTSTGPGSWSVVANAGPAGSTAVQTYPDTQQLYTKSNNAPDPLSSFSSIVSSFTEKMGEASGTSAEAAYDIWLGQNSSTNYADEVMIWNDQINRGTCGGATKQATATFGGSNGVPTQNWTLCKWGGSELIWYLSSGNEQSGSVDVLSMLNWLESHGYLPAGSGLNQIDYGFEICSTPSAETFTVSQYGIKSS
jgi:hypothetical protein